MKKGILTLIVVGLSASAMTGCSAMAQAPNPSPSESSSTSATTTVEPSEPASAVPTESATSTSPSLEARETGAPSAVGQGVSDDRFIELIRKRTTTTYIMGDNEILQIAKDTCKAYDEGGNLKDILSSLMDKIIETTSTVKMDEGTFFGDLAYISGAGVGNYCPEHGEQFKKEVEAVMESTKKS